MSTPMRILAGFLLVVLTLSGCRGGDPAAEPTPTPSRSKTPAATPTALPDPGPDARLGWSLEQRRVGDSRAYWVGVPTCVGSATCADWLDHPRRLIVWLHGARQVESRANASYLVSTMWKLTQGNAVIVFGMSAGDTRVWDADICCTVEKVDEVGYLQDVIADVGDAAPIDPERVGLVGMSNGGMLATKAACERPDLFKVVAVWAASWRGRCDRGPVTIGHWHGTADPVVPIGGGSTTILGRTVTFPPADWLEGRLAKGSTFTYVPVEGAVHWPAPVAASLELLTWFDERL